MNSLDDILAEWADVTTKLDELATRREQLADQLRALGEGSHVGTAGKVTVSQPARRFDAKLAIATLPPEMLTLCQETTVSSTKAKKVLPPALYEQCQSASSSAKPRVTVKLA